MEEVELNQQFTIGDVISKELMDLEIEADTKEDVIHRLAHLLYKNGMLKDEASFVQDVFYRETEGMTGLGEGVAIPHGKSDSVLKTTLAIGKTKKPVPWESLDEQPVNVIILFAVKNTDANTMHIKLLQKVAVMLADEEFITQLKAVSTKEDMMALLSKA